MEHDELASMAAEISLGVPKEESLHCKGEEASGLWDEIVASRARIEKKHPGAQWDIPSEIA